MDPYAEQRRQLPWVRYSRWVLIGTAILQVVLAGIVGASYLGLAMLEARPDEELYALVAAGVCTPLALLVLGVLPAAAAAVGLGRGARWGWLVTIVVGVLNVFPCCLCLPVGGFLLYAMLNDETRGAFAAR